MTNSVDQATQFGKSLANGINMFFEIQFCVQNDTQIFTGVTWTHCVTQKFNGLQHGFPMAHKMTFFVFKVNLLLSNHFAVLSMSKEKSEAQSIPTVVIVVSSANKIILLFSATFGRSLMKRRNRSGPSTTLCGTPLFTGFISKVFDPILM